MTTRVLHLLASADRRGAEVFATELVRHLEGYGLANDVLALAPAADPDRGLEVEVIPGSRAAALRTLRQGARRADVVVGHGSRGLPAGTIGTLLSGRPFVYRSIGDPAQWSTTAARRLRVGLQLRRAAAVVSLWDDGAAFLRDRLRVDPARIVVIPNAADSDRFTPATAEARADARRALGIDPDTGPVLLVVGAFASEKRIPLAVEAAGRVGGTVLVVGDGPERAEVERAAHAASARVVLLGTRPDLHEVYAAADGLVSASRTEGQPGVLIEATLMGLATAATDVGGCGSVAGPRSTLVDTDATAADLAAGATRALAVAPMSDRQRDDYVDRFGMRQVARRWASLLDEVATAGQPEPTGTLGRVGEVGRGDAA